MVLGPNVMFQMTFPYLRGENVLRGESGGGPTWGEEGREPGEREEGGAGKKLCAAGGERDSFRLSESLSSLSSEVSALLIFVFSWISSSENEKKHEKKIGK